MSKRTQIWSSGGGVQSTAIAAMIVTGAVEPPDLAVIVDTERECSTTWDYLDRWVIPALAGVGVTLHRVPKSDFATVDLWRSDDLLIPAYTSREGGSGRLHTYCSNEWKSRVVRRWASAQGVTTAALWIGFSTDEMLRAWRLKEGETEKWNLRFPLLDAKMNRHDCLSLVQKLGWPLPRKSRCWMCPNQNREEWRETMAGPDASKVRAFEREVKDRDRDVWLTKDCKPISKIDFSHGSLDLFSECESGMCFV